MEELEIIRNVIEIIMFAAISILAVYLVIYIKKISSSVNDITAKATEIAADVKNTVSDIKPVIKDISDLAEKVNKIGSTAVRISGNAEELTDKVMVKAKQAEGYIDAIQDAAEYRYKAVINVLNALNNGFRVFYKKLK